MKAPLLFALSFGLLLATELGAQDDVPKTNEAAILAAVESYVRAFNSRDAKSLADLWSPDAVYINRTSGEEVVGRVAIADQFLALFKEQPELELEAQSESIQFVSPNVAVEQGTAKWLAPKSEPEQIAYSAVYVKRDGKWLLDRVTDTEKETPPPSHYEQLKVLEWMIGRWGDESENADFTVDCNWTKNKNFLTRAFMISVEGQIDFGGMQIIGWDPAAKTIRSWTFDSNGTFAEATWSQKGDRWFIHNKGVLPDGQPATMVNVMRMLDDNTLTWQTIERTAGGELLPNIDEIRIVRR